MLNPRSIAVYGASTPMKMGTMQALACIGSGFPGEIHYIHPRLTEVLGRPAHRSVTEVKGPVDLGLIVIPAAAVPSALDDLGKKGVRFAVVTTAGFEEVDTDEGRRLNKKMIETARRHDIRLIGPNCLGVVNGHLPLNTTTFPAQLTPGPISIASHSGSYSTQIFPYMEELEPGLGLRYVLSLGNEGDIDVVDALELFMDDPLTTVACLYLEGIRRGREFIRAARALSLKKPVVAHFVGGNTAGARAGSSHTAAMGIPDQLARGLFAQCGIIPADGIGEVFDFARVLSQSPPMAGNRVAVITNSGGPGSSAAYTCEKEGLVVPELGPELKQKIQTIMPATAVVLNPVDFTFDTDMSRFREVTKLVLESEDIDAVLVYGLFVSGFFERRKETYASFFPDMPMEPVLEFARAFVAKVAELPHQLKKPMVMASMMGPHEDGFRAFTGAGTPAYPTPERAARALAALSRYWEWRRRAQG